MAGYPHGDLAHHCGPGCAEYEDWLRRAGQGSAHPGSRRLGRYQRAGGIRVSEYEDHACGPGCPLYDAKMMAELMTPAPWPGDPIPGQPHGKPGHGCDPGCPDYDATAAMVEAYQEARQFAGLPPAWAGEQLTPHGRAGHMCGLACPEADLMGDLGEAMTAGRARAARPGSSPGASGRWRQWLRHATGGRRHQDG